ncbi:MAG TPA: S-layer homology domain-containing protein [Dissulfurispiraceae bacterium]|nr:S-layer homology domain-containing protein [Dissulfurispiraceae bacterium]
MRHIWKGFTAAVFVVLTTICLVLVGYDNSVGSTTTGTVWAWGYNGEGELGDGTMNGSPTFTPVQVSGLSGVIAVAGGKYYSLAVQSGGLVWAWGYNSDGELGNGTTTERSTPVQVSGLSGVIAVAAGNEHSLALKFGGTVWAWGLNSDGELGNGTTTNSLTPVQVSGLSGVIAIAAGNEHSLFAKADGTVWASGLNVDGELGNGTTTNSLTPVQVSGLSGVTAVAASGYHSLALKSDGTVWAWGYNAEGELGNGSTTNSLTPVQASNLSGVIAIAGGEFYSLAVQSGGLVWAWGYNSDGDFGNVPTTGSSTPVQVSGLSSVIAVAGGGGHSLAVQSANVFGDIPAGYWAEQYIDAIYNDGITTGCNNRSIYLNCAPDGSDDVWRDQMAAFIIRALYGESFTCTGGMAMEMNCSTTTPYFSDVTPVTDPAFFPYIQKLYELGITTGCNNGQSPLLYCASDDVTRDDMAAYIVRATQIRSGQSPDIFTCDGGVNCATEKPYFSDASPATEGTLFPYIQKMKELGITTGCSASDYCPSEDVTRDEMAAFIARAFLSMH